ncbi:MAG: hypothetical protein E6J00_08000 [Chloroflexi bacterium]|nr:MAG: hypothetical protein E6J00_08000 [Chloroflexota bacterium]
MFPPRIPRKMGADFAQSTGFSRLVQIHHLRLLRTLAAGSAVAAALTLGCLDASADMELAVPVISQQNGAWAGAPLGASPTDTVGSSGCAITALAMLLEYYGLQTDPGALNTWLTQNNGYWADDDVIWDAVNGYTGGQLTWTGWFGPDLQLIQGELDAGRPVIAEVSLDGNEHFVIVTGSNEQGLTINDPWFGDTVNFSDRYGDPSTGIVSIRTYLLPSCARRGRTRADPPAAHRSNVERNDQRRLG